AWAGQRGAALHQYRECVQVLEQELGVAPLEATTQLYQAIKENQVPPVPLQAASPLAQEQEVGNSVVLTAALPGSPSGTLSQAAFINSLNANYPLVGRAREWSALVNAYETIGSDGHVVILEGEAGIGKTRLAEEFLVHI